jgi:hypothetical protein
MIQKCSMKNHCTSAVIKEQKRKDVWPWLPDTLKITFMTEEYTFLASLGKLGSSALGRWDRSQSRCFSPVQCMHRSPGTLLDLRWAGLGSWSLGFPVPLVVLWSLVGGVHTWSNAALSRRLNHEYILNYDQVPSRNGRRQSSISKQLSSWHCF